VNVCGADDLVIQLGNAQASTGEYAAPNSHMTYTIELQDESEAKCAYDLTLEDNTRPGQDGANNFGLQTYYIPMSEFSGCSASAISQVAVKVVGGKDTSASASTEGNATFPVFGFIGFTGDNDGVCEVTQSPELVRPEGYQLVWSDEFDQGSVPDSTKWSYDLGSPLLGGSVWGNNELEHYTDNSTNSYLSGGNLVIQAIHETPDGASAGVIASSARLKTTTDGYWEAIGNEPYGYYEVRAKLPCIAGAWPAIWLLGKEGDWPQRGEIDIMEWSGLENNSSKVSSAIHTSAYHGDVSGAPQSNPQYAAQYRNDMCSEYHNFQLHWTKDQLVMGVDNVTTLTYRKTSPSSDQWPFDQPAFLLLNVAVGGNLGGSVNPSDIAKMTMYVDYVRVWQ